MEAPYHYPPELFQLLVDTIPRLFRSKRDVILFFTGAGIKHSMVSDLEEQLADDRDSINKFDIVRTVLLRLNEAGDSTLRDRREVLKRVVEFEDYSTCWANDRLEAQGFVSRIREVVNVKDSFTRMNQEREAEARRYREAQRTKDEEIRQQRELLANIRREFNDLFAMDNAHKRGRVLESVLNRLFEASGILVREDFRRIPEQGRGVIEQIDGVIELEGHIYLVEMKWLKEPVGVEDVAHHLVRVFNRSASRGIFISYSEYPAIETCKESLSKMVVVLCTLQEFVFLMEKESSLEEFLKAKIRGSIVEKQPFTKVLVQSVAERTGREGRHSAARPTGAESTSKSVGSDL